MYFLGIDIGTSSIKAAVLEGLSGDCLASAAYPSMEMEIDAPKTGWAEQSPEIWWNNTQKAIQLLIKNNKQIAQNIQAIGISYQMHGLVLIDKNQKVLRPAIIWCDSRAAEIGAKAFSELGEEKCLSHLLNSPANFTASKLKWVKDNEPDIYRQIDKIVLPGDYIAMKLCGEINTTVSGLSEGIFWDFKNERIANFLLDYFAFNPDFIPSIVSTFGVQGQIKPEIAEELGLNKDVKIGYRAGDQPNNAFSLNVLNPGEVAATAGTSGVIYGLSDSIQYDSLSRINTFAHVNHSDTAQRLGVLLCVNGTGILYKWLKNNFFKDSSYEEMNLLAETIAIGSQGLTVLPFGNGTERILQKEIGCQIHHLNFNIHNKVHILRASLEGIVFSLQYGLDIMQKVGIKPKVFRAGKANLFLSSVFRDTLTGLSNIPIELYDTDGSLGAARGAALGIGFYADFSEAFQNLKCLQTYQPDRTRQIQYQEAYQNWEEALKKNLI